MSNNLFDQFEIGETYCFKKKNDIALFHVISKDKKHIETDFVFRVDEYNGAILLSFENQPASSPSSFFFSRLVLKAVPQDFRDTIRYLFVYGTHLV